jgi:hypothetical protein
MSPWAIRNYIVHNRLLFAESTVGYNLWIGNNPAATGTGKYSLGISDYSPMRIQEEMSSDFPLSSELKAEITACRTELQKDDVYRKHALQYIKMNFASFLKRAIKKAGYAWYRDPTNLYTRHPAYWLPWFITLVLFVAGLIFRIVSEKRYDWLLWGILLASTLMQMVFFVIPRLRYPVYPIVFLFTAHAFMHIFQSVFHLSSRP